MSTERMTDQTATLAQLRSVVEQFVHERQWEQFHTPKNLAMALAIEAAELMEHFQWRTTAESQVERLEPEVRQEVADELADVFCYTLAMANALGIDLAVAFEAKMVKNVRKYPAGG